MPATKFHPERTSISIIIPTLDEADFIAATLASIPREPELEVIVVDGGSRDETPAIARSLGAQVFHSDPGRARQMNLGAAKARGEVLLFLHADTCLPEGFAGRIHQSLRNPRVAAGAFCLRLEPPLKGSAWIERMANWRAEKFHLPYGDQALFVSAAKFKELGGYKEIPLLEDVELVRRLRRVGRLAMIPVPVAASSRRWRKLGVWKTTWINQLILIGYFLGIPPGKLASWYYRIRA
jgi:rSAM/selenodomain-associated transferase 2